MHVFFAFRLGLKIKNTRRGLQFAGETLGGSSQLASMIVSTPRLWAILGHLDREEPKLGDEI